MKIKLTKEQLVKIKGELIKEENKLKIIPKSGHGWDIIDCKDNIHTLRKLLDNKELNIYTN